MGCENLTSLTFALPSKVESIVGWSFTRSNITSLVIPDSAISIGDGAFLGCKNLTSITIGKGVTSIGSWVFSECDNISTVTIDCNIVEHMFYENRSLTSVTIGNNVPSIGDSAFQGCENLTSLTFTSPSKVTRIGTWSFQSTKLTNLVIPDSVISIGQGAFHSCSNITNLTIGNKVESIEENAFNSNGFTSITIPNSVKSIGNYAFGESNLISVTFEGTIPSSGFSNDWAFYHRFLMVTNDLRNTFYATDPANGTPGTYELIGSPGLVDVGNGPELGTLYEWEKQ